MDDYSPRQSRTSYARTHTRARAHTCKYAHTHMHTIQMHGNEKATLYTTSGSPLSHQDLLPNFVFVLTYYTTLCHPDSQS